MKLPPSLATLIERHSWTRVTDGQGGGRVFRLDGPDRQSLYLKYGVGVVADGIVDEMVRLRWLGAKLAVPEIVHLTSSTTEAWLLTNAVAGKTVAAALDEQPSERAAIVAAAATFLRQIHSLPADLCPFNAAHPLCIAEGRRNIDAGLVDADDFDADHQGWTPDQVWQSVTAMLPLSFETVVTHGDFSPENILIDGGRVVACLDVGRAGTGDPYRDIAIFWARLADYGEALQALFLTTYGIVEPDSARLRFHLLLGELF